MSAIAAGLPPGEAGEGMRHEPAFQPTAHDGTGSAVTVSGSLPQALLAKLEQLRLAGNLVERS